jgi:hypothetical protein
MAVGANRRAVLDQLNPPNTGVSGYGLPGGVQAPPLTPAAAPGLQLPNEQAAPFAARGTPTSFSDGTASGFTSYAGTQPKALSDPFFQGSAAERAQGASAFADFQRGRGQAVPTSSYSAARDSGLSLPNEQAAPLTPPPEAAPASNTNYAMRGFDAGKLAGGGESEKYKIGRIMQKYDPRGGVTPAMLAELNALGIADFSGQGDQLTVNNTKNDPRFGKGGTADVVYGLKGNNADTAWQPWFMDEGGAAGGVTGAQGGMPLQGGNAANPGLAMAQSNLSGLLQGDPYSALQQALGRTQQPNLQALINQLGGQ